VKPLLKALLDLQTADLHLSEVRTRLAAYPKTLAAVEARVVAARAELEKCKAAQLENLKQRKKFELDVEGWKEKAKKYREQSYQVKTNDAFKALQHETQTAEQEIAKAEDRLLEQMVSSEEYDRRIKAAEKSLKEVDEAARSERAKVQADQAVAERELAELEAERARLLASVPEDMLDHYERIARKHNGVALAEVRLETCSACGVRIRPHVFQELRRTDTDEVLHCETCTRILYYVEPPPAQPSPPAASAAQASAVSNEP
jgi:predicted  nucleic acid-binding Zn-ribbon protein